ncbi:MAG: hypothetical protein JKY53_08205 [Flavobacteriales bacterium]|nr:hypothetical protein [Flavobacteriales bacterium]
MKIKDKNNVFELSLKGYESPSIRYEQYDSNWLQINIKVQGLQAPWEVTDNMLLTWEVAFLADWISKLNNNEKSETILEFIEPNLRFENLGKQGDNIGVRIWFELEARPSWIETDGAYMDDLYLAFGIQLRNGIPHQ